MDDKIIESYLDNIAELVVDEDKIVTYKSLSRSLGIHVNTAKQLLYTYLTQQKAENVFPISATYLLAGKLADGGFNITVINESELESTYSKFTEITSEHIYSIQKSKNGVKEINILCGVDKGAQESTSLVITSSKCVLKSKDEVKKKQESNNQENKEAIKKAFGAEKVCVQESNKKVESPMKTDIVKVSPKKQKEKTQANIKKAGGNIANMFAKAAQKQAEKPKNNKSEENEQRVLNSDKEEEAVKSEKDISVLDISIKTGHTNTEGMENLLGNADSLSDEEFEIFKSKKSEKTTPNASLKKKKGSKRKRICMDSDSNDSSDDDGKPSQTPIEEDDSKSQPATPVFEDDEDPTESQPLNKRKKRKIVDKTIMLNDGYLETKKEVVFVTDSDDDDEEPKKDKKSKPTAKPKPATTNAAKKQSSLLTFFKKS